MSFIFNSIFYIVHSHILATECQNQFDAGIKANVKQATALAMQRQKTENANSSDIAATLINVCTIPGATYKLLFTLPENAPATAKTIIEDALEGGSSDDLVLDILVGLTNGFVTGIQENFAAIGAEMLEGRIKWQFI